jgi:hypothetical protein
VWDRLWDRLVRFLEEYVLGVKPMALPDLVKAVTTDATNLHADIDAVSADQSKLTADQAKQTADTAQQTTDETALGTALNGPPIQVLVVCPDASGNSVAYIPTGGTGYQVLAAVVIPPPA